MEPKDDTGMGLMRYRVWVGVALCVAWIVPAVADDPGRVMNDFFAIWSDNARVTEGTVDTLYAPQVDYYGHRLSRAGVYREKMAFVRRWPDRTYVVVPGSIQRVCDESKLRCHVDLLLAWRAVRPGHSVGGRATVAMTLVRQGDAWQIVSETGHVVRRAPAG